MHNPSEMPVPGTYDVVEEPFELATVVSPSAYIGPVMELCQQRRGTLEDMRYLSPERAEIHYLLPLAEIIFDFFDQLKSRTRGYASLDYEHWGYEPSDLVKVDIMLQGEPVDAFSVGRAARTSLPVRPRHDRAAAGVDPAADVRGRDPGHRSERASSPGRSVSAKRKDVLAKCYGGDITRKRKLLEKQKEGKKRMRRVGRVDVPQEAFIAALRVETSSGSRRRTERNDRSSGWEPELRRAGLYVHVPFCLTRCGYCDFNTYAGLDELRLPYVEALVRRRRLPGTVGPATPFVSMFLGGGTPTTLPTKGWPSCSTVCARLSP